MTRADVNKEVRHVLARHRVDVSLITYQCHGHEVEIQGIMWHTNDTDFSNHEIDALMKDFILKLPGYEVKGNTENWLFSSTGIKSTSGDASESQEDNQEAAETTSESADESV